MNELDPKIQKIMDERLIPAMRDLMSNRDELEDAWNSSDPAASIKAIMKKYLEPYFPGMEDVQKRIVDKVEKIKDEPRKMNMLAKFLSGEISLDDNFDPNEFLKDVVSEIAQLHDQNEFMKAAYGLDSALKDSKLKDAYARRRGILPRLFGGDKKYDLTVEATPGDVNRGPLGKGLRVPQKRTRKEIIQEEITGQQKLTSQELEVKGTAKKESEEDVSGTQQEQAERQNMESYNDELAVDMAQRAQEMAEIEGSARETGPKKKKTFMEKLTSGKGIATTAIGGGMTISAIIGTMLSGGSN